jgi:hypothetical protein
MYENTWNRVSSLGTGALGVGFNEARLWHRRAYGGLVGQLLLSHGVDDLMVKHRVI